MCAILFAVRFAGSTDARGGLAVAGPVAGRMRVALSLVAATLAACAMAVAVIWASYGFRYAMFRHFEPNRIRSLVGWDVLEDQGGPLGADRCGSPATTSSCPNPTSTGSRTPTVSPGTARHS
jgi:hypothetical protein